MKKVYFILSVALMVTVLTLLVIDLYNNQQDSYFHQHQHSERFSDVYLDDEEYLIYPSDSLEGKWCIAFPSDELYVDLKPEQIALFLKSGEINPDTSWIIYPQCEYQLELYEDELIISDFGRIVAEVPLNQTGKLKNILLKDNE